MAKHDDRSRTNTAQTESHERGCNSYMENTAIRYREKREARRSKPLPWILLKLCVFFTGAIMVYAFYVYVGRFCVPMIRRDQGAFGSRGLGSEFVNACYWSDELCPAESGRVKLLS